jgi:two-component system OmpR family sensor kinase
MGTREILARRLERSISFAVDTTLQGPESQDVDERWKRPVRALERLLALPVPDLVSALTHACNLVAEVLRADKVDAFLHDKARASLVAVGSSTQPLSDLQIRLGLNVLPIANGGRVVHVFQSGQTFVTGRLENDPEELKGVKESLKIRSKIGVPLEVAGQRRGTLMIASLSPDHFKSDEVRFAELVVGWIGMVAHRAELVEAMTRTATERGQAAAEELITVLAHDLRNLLAPIGIRLDLIHGRAERDNRKSDCRDVAAASSALDRLSRLISSILDMARIEQGIFDLSSQPLDLAELARDVARLLSTPAHAIEVAASGEIIVTADPERLRQCLENLVTNAVKHSPEGAPVTLLLRTERHGDAEWARLDVRNDGLGIAPDVLPHIFDRFVTRGPRSGLGLGLYIARRIAEAHGGELTVESEPGKGARFTLGIPRFRLPSLPLGSAGTFAEVDGDQHAPPRQKWGAPR